MQNWKLLNFLPCETQLMNIALSFMWHKKVLQVFLELSGKKWHLFYTVHRFQFKIPFKIPTKNHLLTGRFLAESSFTNKAAVANISSPWTACSGCKIKKNDKVNVVYSVQDFTH